MEISRYLDHLWEFIGLPDDGSAFDHWVENEPQLIQTGLGYDYPSEFESALGTAGGRESEFRQVLICTTEVLYTSMYAAADEEGSRRFLLELARSVVPLGVVWPNLNNFTDSRWTDGNGWGNRPTEPQIAAWRDTRCAQTDAET